MCCSWDSFISANQADRQKRAAPLLQLVPTYTPVIQVFTSKHTMSPPSLLTDAQSTVCLICSMQFTHCHPPSSKDRLRMQVTPCFSRVTFGGVSVGGVCLLYGLQVPATVAGPHIDAAIPPPSHQHGPSCGSHTPLECKAGFVQSSLLHYLGSYSPAAPNGFRQLYLAATDFHSALKLEMETRTVQDCMGVTPDASQRTPGCSFIQVT